MSWGGDPSGNELFTWHESGNKRGYWLEGETRHGVTAHDPPRYKKHTVDQMQRMGWGSPPAEADWSQVRGILGGQTIRLTQHGTEYEDTEDSNSNVTRHTVLGRLREIKQITYYGGLRGVMDDAENRGLLPEGTVEAWDHMEVDVQLDGQGLVVRELDGAVVAAMDKQEVQSIEAERAGVAGEFEEYLARQDRDASELELRAREQGWTLEAMGFALDEVSERRDEIEAALQAIESDELF